MCQPGCVTTGDNWSIAAALLRVSTQVVEGIQDGLARRGFDDVRPAHGFAFVRISAGDATTADLAAYLGVTKQAASQLVDHLVQRGYVIREPDPTDARARHLRLTERGRACTEAAQAAAEETVEAWRQRLTAREYDALRSILATIVVPGRVRPTW